MFNIEKNIYNGLTANNPEESFHPNNTYGLATAPPITRAHYQRSLKSLGYKTAQELPKSFDWRDIFKLSPVMNQKSCGCCWAFAASSSYCDRWMIAKKKNGLVFNPLPVVVCVAGRGCGGGLPENCQEYFFQQGAIQVSSKCENWDDYCSKNENCLGSAKAEDGTMPNISCEKLISSCGEGFKAIEGGLKSNTVLDNTGINILDTIN